jgi:hypothetical protein
MPACADEVMQSPHLHPQLLCRANLRARADGSECSAGALCNHLDISSELAGVLYGMTNTAATSSGIVGVRLTVSSPPSTHSLRGLSPSSYWRAYHLRFMWCANSRCSWTRGGAGRQSSTPSLGSKYSRVCSTVPSVA